MPAATSPPTLIFEARPDEMGDVADLMSAAGLETQGLRVVHDCTLVARHGDTLIGAMVTTDDGYLSSRIITLPNLHEAARIELIALLMNRSAKKLRTHELRCVRVDPSNGEAFWPGQRFVQPVNQMPDGIELFVEASEKIDEATDSQTTMAEENSNDTVESEAIAATTTTTEVAAEATAETSIESSTGSIAESGAEAAAESEPETDDEAVSAAA